MKKMSKCMLIGNVLCILILVGCEVGFRKHTIAEVSQVLYDEGLICSKELNDHLEYSNGTQDYILRPEILCLSGHQDGSKYSGRIALYPTRSELQRVTKAIAEDLRNWPSTYSEFIQGNVVIRIFPAVPEEDAKRFQHALDSLK
jgi:hypothetical protein